MPSFTSRHYTPDRFRSLSKTDDDMMEDVVYTHSPGLKNTATHLPTLAPSDGSLLDYFDLPSPPSTPHQPTHSLSLSSLNSLPSPTTSSSSASSPGPTFPSAGSSPLSSSTTTRPRWPTLSQRIHHRLPIRPRSRSTSSISSTSSASSSSSSSPSQMDIDAADTGDLLLRRAVTSTSTGTGSGGGVAMVRPARRTPYYPPNASRNPAAERTRVYMNRGPHYLPNWTPLGSLPRHVQLQIEEQMVKFTASSF